MDSIKRQPVPFKFIPYIFMVAVISAIPTGVMV
jgi:hypothetical protein